MSRKIAVPLLLALATACTEPRVATQPAAERCRITVIAEFTTAPDGELLAALGATIGGTLSLVRPMAVNLSLIELEAAANCEAALERLRRDPHVRSAEPDERRRIN